jgi:hypothetical protein
MIGAGDVPAYFADFQFGDFTLESPKRFGPFYCAVCEAVAPYIFFRPGYRGYRKAPTAYCGGHASLVAWMVTLRIDRALGMAE